MSDRGVSGMIALVTGASGALGRAIAVRLGTGGAIVACHYGSNRMGAQETLDAIRAGGGDGMTVGGNVTFTASASGTPSPRRMVASTSW